MTSRPFAIVTGVGPGTGAAVVREFAAQGYTVAMLARSSERLTSLNAEIANTLVCPCDVTDTPALNNLVKELMNTHGTPQAVVHNAVGGAFGDFLDIDPEVLEKNFQVNTMALLHLARAVAPAMIEAGKGSILATGNTSAYRLSLIHI